ncbi:MAG TPA: hypothetical protein VGB28_03610 [Actinomycetota bacterium]|jgi:hypothetical protein
MDVPTPRPRRFRLEASLLAVLVLAATGLAGMRLAGGGATARGAPPPRWGNEGGLACLKRVVDGGLGGSGPRGEPGLERVVRRVQDIRGLRFEEVPEPAYLDQGELLRRASEAADYPADRARADALILTALGVLEPGTDLGSALSEAVGEGIAGYYEPATGELVILGSEGDGLDELEEVILAHELTHALTDQVLGLPSLDDPPAGGEDALFASVAVVEGDATLAEAAYSASGGLVAAVTSIPALTATSGVAGLPYHFRRGFMFPYAEGLGFACALYERGGWDAVDEAYRDLPVSTAQILFPERYLRGEVPIDPRDPVGPGPGWTALGSQAWGAADLLFLFEAPGDDPLRALDRPTQRARAWAGGEVHLWERTGDAAVALVLVEKGSGLCASVESWYREAFPADGDAPTLPTEAAAFQGARQDAVVRCQGDQVRVGLGPELAVARRIAA